MSKGKLNAPKIITDFQQRVVCTLPVGFYFDDNRWEIICKRYEEKGNALNMPDLKELFPEEKTAQSPSEDTGENFDHLNRSEQTTKLIIYLN